MAKQRGELYVVTCYFPWCRPGEPTRVVATGRREAAQRALTQAGMSMQVSGAQMRLGIARFSNGEEIRFSEAFTVGHGN